MRAATDYRDLIALVAGRAEIVEGEGQLRIATNQVAGFDEQSGERVVDAAALAGGLRERNVDKPVLSVVHVDRALGHTVRHDRTGDDDTIAVDGLDPVVVLDADLLRVDIAHPNVLPTP